MDHYSKLLAMPSADMFTTVDDLKLCATGNRREWKADSLEGIAISKVIRELCTESESAVIAIKARHITPEAIGAAIVHSNDPEAVSNMLGRLREAVRQWIIYGKAIRGAMEAENHTRDSEGSRKQ